MAKHSTSKQTPACGFPCLPQPLSVTGYCWLAYPAPCPELYGSRAGLLSPVWFSHLALTHLWLLHLVSPLSPLIPSPTSSRGSGSYPLSTHPDTSDSEYVLLRIYNKMSSPLYLGAVFSFFLISFQNRNNRKLKNSTTTTTKPELLMPE